MMEGKLTWPPEKPTATTPSCAPLERNFGSIIDVVVMLGEVESCEVFMVFSLFLCLWEDDTTWYCG